MRAALTDAERDKLKKRLPAFLPSGDFETRKKLRQHSGVLCLDFDHLGDLARDARDRVAQDPHTIAAFLSASGGGVKVLVPVKPDEAGHKESFAVARDYFKERHRLGADEACKDVGRLCFVSYDPDMPVMNCAAEVFPSEVDSPLLLSTPTLCTLHSAPYTLHPTLQKQGDGGGGVVARVGAMKRLREADPIVCDLYEKLVLLRAPVAPNKRNEWLTEAVPFLFRAVSGPMAERLATVHLELNRDVYHGPIDEHMKSLNALWRGCESNYPRELSPTEAGVFEQLEDDERAAFRIMRDLAKSNGGEFFMSCDQLQARLSSGCNGWRMLKRFCGLEIIEQVRPGQRRAENVRGRAAFYRWLLAAFPSTGQPGAPTGAK